MDKKKGICVACSRKPPGRCVVVWCEEDNAFYRLISNSEDGEAIYPIKLGLTKDEYLPLGSKLEFNVVDMNVDDQYQPENIAVDVNSIKVLSSPSLYDAIVYAEHNIYPNVPKYKGYLFNDKGQFESLYESSLRDERCSFIMAEVYNLRFHRHTVSETSSLSEHDKCVADFSYNFKQYKNVSVTLRDVQSDLSDLADDEVSYPRALVCFSLTKPYGSSRRCYICLCALFRSRNKKR